MGLATAKRFVEEGAHVVITGRREKELKEAAAFIERNVTTVVGDVSRLEDLDRLYAVVKEKHGHIDILFTERRRGYRRTSRNGGRGTFRPDLRREHRGLRHSPRYRLRGEFLGLGSIQTDRFLDRICAS